MDRIDAFIQIRNVINEGNNENFKEQIFAIRGIIEKYYKQRYDC